MIFNAMHAFLQEIIKLLVDGFWKDNDFSIHGISSPANKSNPRGMKGVAHIFNRRSSDMARIPMVRWFNSDHWILL